MLRSFYHSFPLERERLQLPKLHKCGYLALYVKKYLALTRWARKVQYKTINGIENHTTLQKQKDNILKEKIKIVNCGDVAQALYRYLNCKYKFKSL